MLISLRREAVSATACCRYTSNCPSLCPSMSVCLSVTRLQVWRSHDNVVCSVSSQVSTRTLSTQPVFSARCNIQAYISRLYYDVSVRLSVTELLVGLVGPAGPSLHWRIIANLGFKLRSHFTAHCGRRAACGRIISRNASQCQALLFFFRGGSTSRATNHTTAVSGEFSGIYRRCLGR